MYEIRVVKDLDLGYVHAIMDLHSGEWLGKYRTLEETSKALRRLLRRGNG